MSLELRSTLVALGLAACCHAMAWAQATPAIKLGGTCDLTGSTKIIGLELCPGVRDYIALVNKRGGVQGHRLQYIELDNAYVAPRAIEAYEQLKREGVVSVFTYGVPTLRALTPHLMKDQIPSLNPGTGRADAIDGESWRYIFPGTASYWSQAGLALKYIKEQGAKPGTRIAYLYVDSPAGREGEEMVDLVARKEGYVVRSLAVQPPGYELDSQVNEIVREFKADWVIASLFGRPAGVAIKEFHRSGFSMNRLISFVYGAGEADVEAAGWESAQGYLGVQFAAIGRDAAVVQDIVRMLRDEGKEVPRHVGTAYYNRGVLTGALMVEAVRLALQTQGAPLTGDKVRKGYESIRAFNPKFLTGP